MSRIYRLSKQFVDELKSERLHRLEVVRRDLLEQSIEMAKDGDDRENDGYLLASELNANNDMRIEQINEILMNCEIIEDFGQAAQQPKIGCKVEVELQNGEKKEFILCDPLEADPDKGLLSVESPLGKKLLKKLAPE